MWPGAAEYAELGVVMIASLLRMKAHRLLLRCCSMAGPVRLKGACWEDKVVGRGPGLPRRGEAEAGSAGDR